MEKIPIEAGQQAEERSFVSGYRGAWFQCKIREIITKNGILGYISEYSDYPDEKVRWRNLYQLPPYCMGKAKQKHKELMLRPQYPPIYNEKQMPDVSEISEVTVIVCDSWKVGDLVDWPNAGCYWSGRITQLFNDQEAQIELKPRPHGEGSSYKVTLKDLRPSLDWCPDHGWTVATQEGDTGHPYARLIKPINRVIRVEDAHNAGQEIEAFRTFSSPISSNSVVSSEVEGRKIETHKRSQGPTVSEEQKSDREKSASHECGDSSTRKTNRAENDSRHSIVEEAGEVEEDDLNYIKFSAIGGGTLNLKRFDTLEASVLELEEYINKIKWLKKILKYGISSFEGWGPQWEFVDSGGALELPKSP
ncbi:hypothetical protein C2S53_019182 [Perilla frutescens var. hirtella]|uniref:Agenet domain-containing protein n=1 Tax=Perilla frutescens var. hirtella TaxID=608512 RepID=A0AAD4IU76_PERFH|nr:hypothetical protein C2S53_019182 [Perilla frutescens var. hirtella]